MKKIKFTTTTIIHEDGIYNIYHGDQKIVVNEESYIFFIMALNAMSQAEEVFFQYKKFTENKIVFENDEFLLLHNEKKNLTNILT